MDPGWSPGGLAALAVAVVAWSLAPSIVSRASLRARLEPLGFNGWRMLFAALATLPAAVLLEGFPGAVPWLDPVFEAGVWLGGVAGSVFGDGLFVAAVARLGASLALPVSYLFVIWTGLVDYVLGAAGPLVLLGAVLSVAGVAVVASGPGPRGGVDAGGLAAAVGASLIWAGSMYAYQAALEKAPPLSVAEARAVFMVLVLLPWMRRWSGELRRVLPETLASAVLGYVVGAVAFLAALAEMPASAVAVGLAATPVLTQALSSRIAGERLSPRLVLGGILVAAGVAAAGLASA